MNYKKKSTENMKEKNKAENSNKKMNITEFWQDKNHKDLLFYLVVGIFMLELIVGVAAFFYGIVNATPGTNGQPPRFQFPLLAYAIAAVIAPAILLLVVHLLGIGLFRSLKRSQVEEAAWKQHLPARLLKIYTIVQGAPTALLLMGIVALGIALFYMDGAMQALLRLGSTLENYLVWIIAGIVLTWCITYITRIWFKYRVKRMEAEYQYRHDIFESSGIIIVDKNSIQLPPATVEVNPHTMLESGQVTLIEISDNKPTQEEDSQYNTDSVVEIIDQPNTENKNHNKVNNDKVNNDKTDVDKSDMDKSNTHKNNDIL